jgi:hypothetical protein
LRTPKPKKSEAESDVTEAKWVSDIKVS